MEGCVRGCYERERWVDSLASDPTERFTAMIPSHDRVVKDVTSIVIDRCERTEKFSYRLVYLVSSRSNTAGS